MVLAFDPTADPTASETDEESDILPHRNSYRLAIKEKSTVTDVFFIKLSRELSRRVNLNFI